ncbi:AMP-binding protein [Nocardia stercoris]|uniref:Fatty-acid--CoA ligase n=1 Tax=Nocardia stercoris TaxID=2483361 RepID=A0A3M2L107_9NOCA|nr:AMP-binding protein [Nocardia stercoris]RMI31251.1 fatty-acid--CoA ligase [Nocardia stercoris]
MVCAEFAGQAPRWARAVPPILASGALRPVGPRAVADLARSLWLLGPTPAMLLTASAIRYPDRVAIVDDDGALTYGRLREQFEAVAAAIAALAPRRPASVGILCRNHRGFVVAMGAGARLGAELIFVNTELPQQQLQAILERHDPDVLIYDEEYAAAVADSQFRGLRVLAWHEQLTGTDDLPTLDVLAQQRHPAPPPVRKAVKVTLLTSGTTGVAKGVPRAVPMKAIAELSATAMTTLRLRSRDTALVAPPFFHAYGLAALLGPLVLGGTLICHRRYDAAQVLDDIARHRVTVLMAVPVMLQRLLEVGTAGADLTSLRLVVTGAAPISPTTITAVIDTFGPILVNGYGSTEAGLVAIATQRDLAEAPSTLGRPALGVSIRILRPDWSLARVGETGRIFVRGGLGYDGYTPDRVARPRAKEIVDGYVDTGDMGFLDAQGRLYIDGRSDDMIVSGGENVFPGEVEDRLVAHPDVTDAVVIGVADTEFGQVLHAFVVLAPGADPTDDELKRHVKAGLERYKVPKRFTRIDRIPRNPSGKVVRSKLQAHNES